MANGKLADRDDIRIMFMRNLGGGTWDNWDTSGNNLEISSGTITPAFVPGAAPGGAVPFSASLPGRPGRITEGRTLFKRARLSRWLYRREAGMGPTYLKINARRPIK